MPSIFEAASSAPPRQFRRECPPGLLSQPELSHPNRQLAHATDHRGALGHRDRTSRIEQVKKVRTFQRQIVSRQNRKSVEILALRLGPCLQDSLGFRFI